MTLKKRYGLLLTQQNGTDSEYPASPPGNGAPSGERNGEGGKGKKRKRDKDKDTNNTFSEPEAGRSMKQESGRG